jgi:hypothetical protein
VGECCIHKTFALGAKHGPRPALLFFLDAKTKAAWLDR